MLAELAVATLVRLARLAALVGVGQALVGQELGFVGAMVLIKPILQIDALASLDG